MEFGKLVYPLQIAALIGGLGLGGLAFYNYETAPIEVMSFNESFFAELTNVSVSCGKSCSNNVSGIKFTGAINGIPQEFILYTNDLLKCGYTLNFSEPHKVSISGLLNFKITPNKNKIFEDGYIVSVGGETHNCKLEISVNPNFPN
jgi:hypothetical protein